MVRAQIVIAVDEAAEVAAYEAWVSRWQGQITLLSENSGCGCCVDIWEAEGPREAFDQLPTQTVTVLE